MQEDILTDDGGFLCGREGLPDGNKIYSLMRGVFSVGERDFLVVIRHILTDEGGFLCGREGLPDGNKIYSLMRGVFSVGERDSLLVIRYTHG